MKMYRERPTGWRVEDGEEVDPIVVRLYGGQDYPGNTHYVIFDLRTMRTTRSPTSRFQGLLVRTRRRSISR